MRIDALCPFSFPTHVMKDKNLSALISPESQNRIYHLALGITRNEKDAEDVLQNTIIKAMRSLKSFRNKSALSTWAYRIAYNESLIFLRKKRRFVGTMSRIEPVPAVNWSRLPDQQLLDAELRQRIETVLQNLPAAYRMPLLLHRIEGFSISQTGRILNIRSSTVKTRLHRAYLMVRDQIKEYYQDKQERGHEDEATCPVWTGFIREYALGKVRPDKKARFDRHIQDCPGCTAFLDAYLQAIRITGALSCQDIPSELKARLDSFLKK